MKIYTRTGDAGETGLYGGERVSKSAVRVAACGTVDETISFIGLAASLLPEDGPHGLLRQLQSLLFELGADLAAPHTARQRERLSPVTAQDSSWLEEVIDRLDADLPPLQNFILPGGHPAAAALHAARSVCRRAERLVVELQDAETVNADVLRFLNRL
ncbi:MAG TPA: cob(I)yrinic acid a,c-diamide adenosyltransferase, partial [Deinococcales bacterium]|nr:cob(I)yrinic acid a,c-diamide adenosyltransferase [Deinococcales bacterium]